MSERDTSEAADRLAQSFGYREVDPEAKAGLVRGVFDRVARRYDLMNDLMSAGVHRLWKEALLDWLAPRPGIELLDVAGGTGDIALRLLDRLGGKAQVTLADINEAMLRTGRDRALDRGWLKEIAWATADAERLPFPDRSFDAYTIAFGIRNVTHLERVLAEAYRTCAPAAGSCAWSSRAWRSRRWSGRMMRTRSPCCRRWGGSWRGMRTATATWRRASGGSRTRRRSWA